MTNPAPEPSVESCAPAEGATTRRALRERERAAQAIAMTGAEARASARVTVRHGAPPLYTTRAALRARATQTARELHVTMAEAVPAQRAASVPNPALGADEAPSTRAPARRPVRLTAREVRQTPHASPRPRRIGSARGIARKVTAASALAFIGALVVVTTLPAQAMQAPDRLDPQVASIEPESQELAPIDAEGETVFTRDDIIVTDPVAAATISDDELARYQSVADAEPRGSSYGGDPALPDVWSMLRTDYVQSPFPGLAQLRITSPFGNRAGGFHGGTDIAPGLGTEIRPIANGVVSEVWQGDNPGGGGYVVFIDHNIDGQFVQSWYAHMVPGSIQVEVGQVVDVTTVIGQVGNSGRSTGPHLHLELKNADYVSFDPILWLQTRELSLERP